MKITMWGYWQTRKPEFRRDLLALIGAGTPAQISDLALAHAQALCRTFTAMTICRQKGQPVKFTTAEVEAFLHKPGVLAFVDSIWNKRL